MRHNFPMKYMRWCHSITEEQRGLEAGESPTQSSDVRCAVTAAWILGKQGSKSPDRLVTLHQRSCKGPHHSTSYLPFPRGALVQTKEKRKKTKTTLTVRCSL